MLLENILDIKSYIYSERYVNKFKKVANEVTERYCAINGKDSYYLPEILLKKDDVDIFLASPKKSTYDDIFSKVSFDNLDEVKFYIHPDMIQDIMSNNEIESLNNLKYKLLVEPTSSTRTVFPYEKNYFIKLHLNKRLSKYIRRLSPSSVEHSINISNALESCIDTCPETFGFLAESIGIVSKELNYGMIIREQIPRPIINKKIINMTEKEDNKNENDERYYLPLFSLYSKDLKHPEDKTLFSQIVDTNHITPLELFMEKYLRPLFIGMNYCINNQGILLEPHGQNVLVEIDNNYNITRLIHRDFQSIYVNNDIRKRNGLKTPFKKHIMDIECPSEVSYSLVYDHFIGRYVFDEFLELLEKEHNISKKYMKRVIKSEFNNYFDKTLFPKNAYFMDKKTFNNNETVFVEDKAVYR